MADDLAARRERRYLEIEFMDGTRASFSFPKQVDQGYGTRLRLDRLLEKPCLMIEFDGAVTFYPTVNIKSVRAHPVPDDLPDYIIRGAVLEA